VTFAAAALALSATASAHAAFPGRNGVLAVVASQPGNLGERSIVLIGLDGAVVRRIPCPGRCGDLWPAWSPNGRLLAFSARLSAVETRIGLVRADGTRRRTLPRPAPFVDAVAPAWSPDGLRIAFGAVGFDVSGIWTVNRTGGDVRRVSPLGQLPAWSTRGKLAVGTGGVAVWTLDTDGTHRRRLTSTRSDDPDWSPDGSRIAYTRFARGREAVYTMTATGRAKRRLASGSMPAWSPDGRSIAFVREGRIFVMSARGRDVRKVPYAPMTRTGKPVRLEMPAWRPRPATASAGELREPGR